MQPEEHGSVLRLKILRWIIGHDDSRIFTIFYIAAAVILSVAVGLFWLCVVVSVHFIFELIKKYFEKNSFTLTLHDCFSALWQVKLDLGLIAFALVIAIYIDVIFGMAGISAGARMAATAGARFASWQRIIRGTVLVVDDFAYVAKAVACKGSAGKDETSQADPKVTKGDLASLVFGITCIFLILISPLLTGQSIEAVYLMIISELHPFPFNR